MQQRIHINRVGLNSIEFELKEITIPIEPGEAVGFELIVINYGNPVHIGLSASDEIGDMVTFLKDNPYVKEEERVPVIVKTPTAGSSREGEILVTTGYGSKKKGFGVKTSVKKEGKKKVIIDDKLIKTPPKEPKRVFKRRKSKIKRHSAKVNKPFDYLGLLTPFLTLFVILVSLAFVFYDKVDVFFGSLFASILIVFLVTYGLRKTVNL